MFQFKNNPEYAHYVFWQLASEYFGDSCASSLLFAVYKECLCNAYCMQCIAAEWSLIEKRSKQPNFTYKAARSFQSRFNNICRYSFLNCFSSFNDYSMPILRTSDFTSFLDASKHIFPKQWAFLLSHRNINQERDGNELSTRRGRFSYHFLSSNVWVTSNAYHTGALSCQWQYMNEGLAIQ